MLMVLRSTVLRLSEAYKETTTTLFTRDGYKVNISLTRLKYFKMITIKIETTKELLDNIIEAYNKEYHTSITVMDVKSLILAVPFIKLNGKEVSWSSVYLYD